MVDIRPFTFRLCTCQWKCWWLKISRNAPKALHSHPNPAQAAPGKTHTAHQERALLSLLIVHSICALPPQTHAQGGCRKPAMHFREALNAAKALGRAKGCSSPGVQHPFIAEEDEWGHPGGISTAKSRWNSVWTCFLDCETNWKIFIQILFFLFFLNPTSLFKLP